MILKHDKFKDMKEWLEAAQRPCIVELKNRSSRRLGGFSQTQTFEEAIKYATLGWREGTANLQSYLVQLTPFLRTIKMYRKAWAPGMLPQGGLILDNYVKGLPDCLLNRVRKPSNKFVKLVINISMLQNIDPSEFFRRGALITALIQTLERSNFRVQIICQNSTEGHDHHLVTEFILKDFNQSLDLDRLTFWICHVAVNRRISFSYRETLSEEWIEAFGIRQHGMGRTVDYIPEDKNTIYFPAISTNNRHFDSIESMIEYLKELLSRVGIQVY